MFTTNYTAHGKVILLGEHAVVYGYDALAVPVQSLKIKTTVSANPRISTLETFGYTGSFNNAPHDYDGLKYVVKTLQEKATRPTPVTIHYEGKIPMQRGLGSSATVALGTTHALSDYLSVKLTEPEIMAITNHAEAITHGKASGLDAVSVNSTRALFFNTKEGATFMSGKLGNGAILLIMDTGDLGSTKEAVMHVHQKLTDHPQFKSDMRELGRLAKEAKKTWENHDQKQLGHEFNQAQHLLRTFDLSTPKIDQLCQLANQSGALGAKLSGSGLGGIVIALCSDQRIAERIIEKSQDLIAHAWTEEI